MNHNSKDWFKLVESLPSGKHKPVNELMLMQVWSQHQNTISLCDCIDLPAEPLLLSGNKAEHWFIGSRQLPFDSSLFTRPLFLQDYLLILVLEHWRWRWCYWLPFAHCHGVSLKIIYRSVIHCYRFGLLWMTHFFKVMEMV